jgi:predicted dehydrogenase
MSTFGIALVGTGFGQKVHLPALQAHPRTQVVAVYHRDLATAQAIAKAHQIPHASDNLADLVARPDVQGVSLSTPPFLHYPMAQVVLNAGKHLLLEKPATLAVAEAQHLAQIANTNSLAVTLNFEFRCIPAWQRLAELVQAGYLGNIRLIKVDWLGASRADPSRAWNWYAQAAQGGGALGSIGSHSFDYLHWLFGPVRGLSAKLSTTIEQRPDPASGTLQPVTSDDTASISLELLDGTPMQVCLSAVTIQGRGHFLELYGDRGTLVLGNPSQTDYINGFTLMGSQGGKDLAEMEIPDRLAFPHLFADGRTAPLVRIIDRWVQGIDGTPTAPTLLEGIYSQLLMDLCHESNLTGTWVKVPDFETFLNSAKG